MSDYASTAHSTGASTSTSSSTSTSDSPFAGGSTYTDGSTYTGGSNYTRGSTFLGKRTLVDNTVLADPVWRTYESVPEFGKRRMKEPLSNVQSLKDIGPADVATIGGGVLAAATGGGVSLTYSGTAIMVSLNLAHPANWVGLGIIVGEMGITYLVDRLKSEEKDDKVIGREPEP